MLRAKRCYPKESGVLLRLAGRIQDEVGIIGIGVSLIPRIEDLMNNRC